MYLDLYSFFDYFAGVCILNSMKLVIVESPAKAKTIEKYLGAEYKVLASVGHIRDIPTSEKTAIDIEAGFVPNYQISKDKVKVVKELETEAKKASEVILATDPDREGEAIAWHLQEALKLKNPKRARFHEITKDAITIAIHDTHPIDMNLKTAQEARRVLDRLFGYTLSKLIWTKVRYGLSAGRVQSPALRILMEKEREIRAFIPEKYWEATATFKRADGTEHFAELEKEITDKNEVAPLLSVGMGATWHIESIKETNAKRNARAPFTTSTLQQAANTRLGLSPSNTMRIAQKLYEKGYITYMRTDSTNLSEHAHAQIKTYVEGEYGAKYYARTDYKTKSKSAQEAHEAIRPTDASKRVLGSTKEEHELYELIHARTVSSQMIAAETKRTVVYFKSQPETKTFVIRGSVILEEGWLKADPDGAGDEVLLPVFTEGEKVECLSIFPKEKETTPPPRYSEAGLVKELEARGIGRPSTYASIIRTLVEREYVLKDGKTLKPTPLGDVVSTFVEKNFENYISDAFTSTMEDTLDEIANGQKEYVKTLSDFYYPFLKAVEGKKDIDKLTTIADAPKEFLCPKCNGPMTIKLSKTGTFMSCAKFPACLGSRTEAGDVIREPEAIGKECPRCSKPLVRRTGRFGDFICCSGYPKCKYIEQDPEEMKKKDSGVVCTKCKKGTMIERNGRFGPFYSCSLYPDCKHIIKTKPTGKHCPECSELMMLGTKTIPERCSIKTCPMHNPHKLNK